MFKQKAGPHCEAEFTTSCGWFKQARLQVLSTCLVPALSWAAEVVREQEEQAEQEGHPGPGPCLPTPGPAHAYTHTHTVYLLHV